jgi:hypothetical protein
LQLLPHCLCHAHVCGLIVEIQKLGQVFFSSSIFLLVSGLKSIHFSYKLFSHQTGSETFLLAVASGKLGIYVRGEVGRVLVMGCAIDHT